MTLVVYLKSAMITAGLIVNLLLLLVVVLIKFLRCCFHLVHQGLRINLDINKQVFFLGSLLKLTVFF